MENVKRALNSITNLNEEEKEFLLKILKTLRSPIGACVSTKLVYGDAPDRFHEKYLKHQAERACLSAEEILNETYNLGFEFKKQILIAFKKEIEIISEVAKNNDPKTFNLW